VAEPELAVVFSPREWADRLVRYVTDHGGGRIRLRVVEGRVALEELFDVLVAEDITSFLSPRLVRELEERGTVVLGVYDPAEPTGRQRLVDMGVDDVVPCDAESEEFVRRITMLAALKEAAPVRELRPEPASNGRLTHSPVEPAQEPAAEGGHRSVVAVGGPPGGCGATEIAIELARAARAGGGTVVLVDADDRAPAVAQRLGLPLTPNIRTAAEVLFHEPGRLADVLSPVRLGGFEVLPGLGHPRDWAQLRAPEAADVVAELATAADHVVVNVGPSLEDLTEVGGPERHGLTRAVLRNADVVVAVAAPTPVGIARLLDWLADLRELAPRKAAHVVVNKAPYGDFARSEIAGEIRRTYTPASLHFVPADPRVETAAWRGEMVKPGPFTKGVAHLARWVLPAHAPRALPFPARALRRLRAT
jgi:MinD-like ATPase involved in chromosome partitioning or flagellar assembly